MIEELVGLSFLLLERILRRILCVNCISLVGSAGIVAQFDEGSLRLHAGLKCNVGMLFVNGSVKTAETEI